MDAYSHLAATDSAGRGDDPLAAWSPADDDLLPRSAAYTAPAAPPEPSRMPAPVALPETSLLPQRGERVARPGGAGGRFGRLGRGRRTSVAEPETRQPWLEPAPPQQFAPYPPAAPRFPAPSLPPQPAPAPAVAPEELLLGPAAEVKIDAEFWRRSLAPLRDFEDMRSLPDVPSFDNFD
jgi:hypothetical protein